MIPRLPCPVAALPPCDPLSRSTSRSLSWPSTRADRLAMENRKEQLRQQRERELRWVAQREAQIERTAVAASELTDMDMDMEGMCMHIPTADQRASLESLGLSVADVLGVQIEHLGQPEATVTCVRDRTDPRRLRPYEDGVASLGMGAEVSVQDGTASLQFNLTQTAPSPMDAGEVITFPLSQATRIPSCDFRIVLSYRAQFSLPEVSPH